MKYKTHRIRAAAEDCAARALPTRESSNEVEDVNKQANKNNEKREEKAGSASTGKKTTGEDNAKVKEGGKSTQKKSEYKIQREKNIEENKLILAQIKVPELEAVTSELKGKKKTKGVKVKSAEKTKPNESARLNTSDMKWVNSPYSMYFEIQCYSIRTKPTDGDSGSVDKSSDEEVDKPSDEKKVF